MENEARLVDFLRPEEIAEWESEKKFFPLFAGMALVGFYGTYFTVESFLDVLKRANVFSVDEDDKKKFAFLIVRTALAPLFFCFGIYMAMFHWGWLADSDRTFLFSQATMSVAAAFVAMQINEVMFFIKNNKAYPDDVGVALVTTPLYCIYLFTYLFWPSSMSLRVILSHFIFGELFNFAKGINFLSGATGTWAVFTPSLVARQALSIARQLVGVAANLYAWYWLIWNKVWDLELPEELQINLLWVAIVYGVGAISLNLVIYSEFKLTLDMSKTLLSQRSKRMKADELKKKQERKEKVEKVEKAKKDGKAE